MPPCNARSVAPGRPARSPCARPASVAVSCFCCCVLCPASIVVSCFCCCCCCCVRPATVAASVVVVVLSDCVARAARPTTAPPPPTTTIVTAGRLMLLCPSCFFCCASRDLRFSLLPHARPVMSQRVRKSPSRARLRHHGPRLALSSCPGGSRTPRTSEKK